MFNFLEKWDPILLDFKCDIEGVIKGEVKMWAVAMQTYCERIMILFNNKEKIYDSTEKITLGKCVNDPYFTGLYQDKTGFSDFASLRRLNEYSNYRKHSGIINDFANDDIKGWIKRLHTMSIKTYNYLEGDSIVEEFNEKEVDKLLATQEEELLTTIEYADQIISRKNDLINQLEERYQELLDLVSDDTIEILDYTQSIKSLEEDIEKNKDRIKKYQRERKLFYKYIELNIEKNHLLCEIRQLLNPSELKNRELIVAKFQKIDEIDQQKVNSIEDVVCYSIEKRTGQSPDYDLNNYAVKRNKSSKMYLDEYMENTYHLVDEDYEGNAFLTSGYSKLEFKDIEVDYESDLEIDKGYLDDDDYI